MTCGMAGIVTSTMAGVVTSAMTGIVTGAMADLARIYRTHARACGMGVRGVIALRKASRGL